MTQYLNKTHLLDFDNPSIVNLIETKGWDQLDDYDKIGAAYDYVQNDIKFGYNRSDDIKASEILQDGYGQCNTKSTLLMALLRALNIQCRFHGFTIDKKLQKGAITGFFYWLAPQNIIHSWVEIFYNNQWINLEGFILDQDYLKSVQQEFNSDDDQFLGYGVGTDQFSNPPIKWQGEDTYIQKLGINRDYGIFDDPDEFYNKVGTNLSGIKKYFYQNYIRHVMNENVSKIRKLVK